MTSTMKVIDQLTLIMAPVATGQVVTYANTQNGALIIAGWNALSFILEYYLLWKVYNTIPALRKDKDKRKIDSKLSDFWGYSYLMHSPMTIAIKFVLFQTYRQTGRQTDRQTTDRQTDRQTDDGRTDRHVG